MMRLDKFLSSVSGMTRKEAKEAFKKGRVSVDGSLAKSGDAKIDENSSVVTLDGLTLSFSAHHTFLLNKPAGYVCSNDEAGQHSVIELFSDAPLRTDRLSSAGRLDKDTTGLLIVTDDGDLIHRITSPRHHIEKEYEALLEKDISDEALRALENGLDIGDEKKTLPAKAERVSEKLLHLTISEGRYHQVKRMVEAVGNRVVALKRVRIGGLTLPDDLMEGQFREMGEEDISLLFLHRTL